MGKSNSKASVPKPIQSATASDSLNKKSAQLSNSTNPQDDTSTPSPSRSGSASESLSRTSAKLSNSPNHQDERSTPAPRISAKTDGAYDPVYAQIQASNDASQDPSNDPVYAQNWQSRTDPAHNPVPHQIRASHDASQDPSNDPVYAQNWRSRTDSAHNPVPHQRRASHEESSDPSDHPDYAQGWETHGSEKLKLMEKSGEPRGSPLKTRAYDPVYAQGNGKAGFSKLNLIKKSAPPRGSPSRDPANDPVYAQGHGKADFSKLNLIEKSAAPRGSPSRDPANDPVYAQPQRSADQDPSNDPVYSQNQASPEKSNPAKSRLSQLSSQLSTSPNPQETASDSASNTKARRKAKRRSNDPSADLPADYSDILGHLERMRSIAMTPDPSDRGYARQKQHGKLWVRERIEKMLLPRTWTEIGSVAGTAVWRKDPTNPQAEHVDSFIPSNNPQGFGMVSTHSGNRTVYLTADDFSVRAGHADGSVGLKTTFGEKLALRLKIPVVKLVDGSSGGGSVTTIMKHGYAYLPHATILFDAVRQMNMGIPNLGAAVGPAIGLGAARVVSTHFNCMAADIGSMFNAGPKVVEGATFEEGLSFSDLGGPNVHCTNGTFDNVAPNEEGCFEMIRTVLGFLPDCGALQAPPVSECTDDVMREDIALRSIIPRRKNRMYDPFYIITSVMDKDSWFEIGNMWGRTSIAGLARLGGRPVGVISNNCEVNGGALDAAGSQKLMKHIKFW